MLEGPATPMRPASKSNMSSDSQTVLLVSLAVDADVVLVAVVLLCVVAEIVVEVCVSVLFGSKVEVIELKDV